MEIPNKFHYKISTPDISSLVKYANLHTMSDLNCIKIATVEETHLEDLTVTVKLLNKKTLGQNPDGTPNVRDYALIRAKICYCNPFITYPIQKGDDCILLFSDREIESWFINGDSQPENYTRMHDLTDAFALFGIRSLPDMIQILSNTLHLFYGSSEIQLQDQQININSPLLNVVGNTVQTGDITATNLGATAAATGTFRTADSKTVTVTNGIITAIA